MSPLEMSRLIRRETSEFLSSILDFISETEILPGCCPRRIRRMLNCCGVMPNDLKYSLLLSSTQPAVKIKLTAALWKGLRNRVVWISSSIFIFPKSQKKIVHSLFEFPQDYGLPTGKSTVIRP